MVEVAVESARSLLDIRTEQMVVQALDVADRIDILTIMTVVTVDQRRTMMVQMVLTVATENVLICLEQVVTSYILELLERDKEPRQKHLEKAMEPYMVPVVTVALSSSVGNEYFHFTVIQ